MQTLSGRWALLLAVASGVGVELAVTWGAGTGEAWDSGAYWMIGYPALIVGAGVLGFAAPERAWRWGALPVPAQFLTMMLRGQVVDPLIAIGLMLGAALSIPCMIAASVAAAIRHRTERK